MLFPHPVRLENLAEACYRFTPRMAARTLTLEDSTSVKHEALFLHLTQEPTKLLTMRLQHLCGRFGLKDHQFGWSTAAPLALARARNGNRPVRTLELSVLSLLVKPFEFDPLLERKMSDMALLMKKLGVNTLGDFLKLPTAGLSSRFGSEALTVHRVLKEGFEPPWPAMVWPEKIIEEADLEVQELFVPIDTIEPLLFLLRGVLSRVIARLHGRNERAVSVQLDFESRRVYLGSATQETQRLAGGGSANSRQQSSNSPHYLESFEQHETPHFQKREWQVIFPVPQRSFDTMFSILKEKIYFDLQKRPLEAPVTVIRLHVLETAPGSARQKDFFHNREQEQEVWSSLVARLTQKLGEDNIFGAQVVSRHLPEKAWTALLKEPEVPKRLIESQRHSGPTPRLAEGNGKKTRDAMIKIIHENAKNPLRDGQSVQVAGALPGALSESSAYALAGLPKRPTRLLPKPLALMREGELLADISSGKRWKVLEWDGPERISGEWWEKSRQFSRDYFRVLTSEGEQLWIFFAGREIFLHGFFD